jgi:hypothetical protein
VKKQILAVLAGVMLSASVAMAAAPAAPAAPVIASTSKNYEGNSFSGGGKSLAVNGTSFYAAYMANSLETDGSANDVVKIVQSTDGGSTWGRSFTISRVEAGTVDRGIGIAASGDSVVPTKKMIHVAWEQNDQILYSSADSTDLTVWSAPVAVSDTISTLGVGTNNVSLLSSATGVIHVLFKGADSKIYYSTAPRFDSSFSYPIALTLPVWDEANGWSAEIASAIDGSGNVHVAAPFSSTPGAAGIKYTRRTASTGTWSSPTTALAPKALYGMISIAAYDTNNVYIARNSDATTLDVFKTSNGGSSWSAKTIATVAAGNAFNGRVSIAVNKSKVITVASAFSDAAGASLVKMYRSTDGTSWSAATTLPLTAPNLAIDTNGKFGMVTRVEDGTSNNFNPPHYFTKEK